MTRLEKYVKDFAYDTVEYAIKKANRKGMKYLRWEIENGVIDEETFNIKLYGTNDKRKIMMLRKKFQK